MVLNLCYIACLVLMAMYFFRRIDTQRFNYWSSACAGIPPDEFEQVQAELARRKRSGRTFSGNSVFASRLICGDCGGYYGQKVWHSNDPYRKVIWRCNRKYGKGQRCSTPTLSEDTIKALFVKAYNLLLGNRETIIEDAETLVAMLEDTAALDTKIAAAQEEIDTVVELKKPSSGSMPSPASHKRNSTRRLRPTTSGSGRPTRS